MIPDWFSLIAYVSLLSGAICSLIIVCDLLLGHRQHMWIMNLVWPISALFGTPFVLWAYYRYGRLATRRKVAAATTKGKKPPNKSQTPFPVIVLKATLHCGSGCTLGDVCAESLALAVPSIAIWLGWQSLFPANEAGKMFAVWILDFLFAFAIGIVFQYFTIVPMRNLNIRAGIAAAVKADTLSLTSWQIGMYGLMAIAQFLVVARYWNTWLKPTMPEFWFVMQIAMLTGLATSYPVNWWLVRHEVKEKM